MSTDCALSFKGLWRDLINGRELKAGQADGEKTNSNSELVSKPTLAQLGIDPKVSAYSPLVTSYSERGSQKVANGQWRNLCDKYCEGEGGHCLGLNDSFSGNGLAANPAPNGSRLKVKAIADPNETAWIPIRRQEPSARTSLQGFFRRSEVGKRESNDG